jgi:hypothetical protein
MLWFFPCQGKAARPSMGAWPIPERCVSDLEVSRSRRSSFPPDVLASMQPLLLRHLCTCHRDESSAASAAREAFFQPKDLVWLDSCDKHRNEEIKQNAMLLDYQGHMDAI